MPLACCVAPSFGFLSHWNIRQYSPLLVLIEIIIVKFLLKITTLKIRSDCFGIKRCQTRPTDCSLQQALHIYYHTWRWKVVKDKSKIRNFSHLWSIKKFSKCGYFWVIPSLYNIQDFIFLAWGPHLEDFQHIIQKIVNIHEHVVGRWTLCDAKTNWNNENKCFYMETSLLRLQTGEIMSNNKIIQFSYFYWSKYVEKADEKTTLPHNEISHDSDIAWCSWKNASWDTIRLSSASYLYLSIVGFHMASLKFRLKNYRSYRDFTFTMH